MRAILLFILLVLTGSCSLHRKEHTRRDKIIEINLGCGYAGVVSSEIDSVQRFIETKNDTALLDLASEKTIGNRLEFQLLAIVAIENILAHRQLKMSLLQEEEIAAFKRRTDEVKVCSGCTISIVTTIHDVLKDRTNTARQLLDLFLDPGID